jgi:hypothetical protein
MSEARCMYYDVSWAEIDRLAMPRPDRQPGKEYKCELCGGVYSLKHAYPVNTHKH